jgi:tryptophanyl-tRNA synthetase
LHQVIYPPCGHAADPGLLDHRNQRLLRRLACLQERRKIAALPQLGNPKLQTAQPGVERAVAVAIAIGCSIRSSLVPAGTDQAFHVGLHQQLHHRLRHAAQEVAVTGFRQQLGQR